VLRDRDSTIESQLLPKRRRRLSGCDDTVLALYARGLTTREIQGHLKELYGATVSRSLNSWHGDGLNWASPTKDSC